MEKTGHLYFGPTAGNAAFLSYALVPVIPVAPLVHVPLAAVLRIDKPLAGLRTGDLHSRMDLYASLDHETIEIEGREIPLEAEPTAALAASLAESQFWKIELQAFLGNAIGVRRQTALFGLSPHRAGRIPVVFVHGTASSPARWADMINDLLADIRLRQRYEAWFFTYDSGQPIAYSGYQLRDALTKAVGRADPNGSDPWIKQLFFCKSG